MTKISVCVFIIAIVLDVTRSELGVAREIKQSRSFWALQKSGSTASLRGLSVVSDKVAWSSGTGGTVLKTTDGKTWSNVSIKAEPELDFRDIEAFSADKAIVVSAGSPGRIYLTKDGGKTWKKVYEDLREEIFFDAMSFSGEFGVVFGDAINGRAQMVFSGDGGETWDVPVKAEQDVLPKMDEGEAGFAASGTCMMFFAERNPYLLIATGGGAGEDEKLSRILYMKMAGGHWDSVETPIKRNATSGIFSIAAHGDTMATNTIVAVGGDYKQPDKASNHIAISKGSFLKWELVTGSTPSGYRSCIAVAKTGEKITWLTVGPNGTDLSHDPGKKWTPVDKGAFHAVAFSKSGKTAWATGPDGRIGKWSPHE